MDSSCVVVPTLTTTEVSTSHRLVTTFTESISTGPDSVSPTVFSTCVQPSDGSSHCQVTIRTSFITVPGNTTTVTVPATLTVDVPVTVLNTLFGSSCSSSSIPSSTPSTPTSTLTSTTDTTSTNTISTTSSPVITTPPPPTAITSNSLVTVTSDGSTFLSYSSTNSAVTADAQSTGSSSDKRIPPGPIIGGVLGGVAALLLLGLLTWYLIKKESKFSNFDEDSHSSPHREPSYKYGMVGQQSSNPVSFSTPDPSLSLQNALGNGGGTGQGVFNDAGFSQSTANGQGVMGNDGGLGQASGQGVFNNDGGLGQANGQGVFSNDMGSGQGTATANGQGILGGDSGLGQVSSPPGLLGTDGGLGQTVSGGQGVVGNLPPISQNMGNPSIIPLVAGIGTAAVASGAYAAATSSRPSSSRPSTTSSSQALGPLVTPAKPQGSYPPALQNWSASYGQAIAGPSTPSNNNNNNNTGDEFGRRVTLSHGSANSSLSAYSNSSWMGNSSTNNRPSDDSSPPGIPPLMGAVVHNPHQQQQYQQQPQNSFRRVSSLQVTNNDYHPYAETSSSSFSMGGAGSSQQAPLYDGKGRPLNMPPEKAPLVHLDGTLYQQPPRPPRPPRGGPRSSGTEPPAYIE